MLPPSDHSWTGPGDKATAPLSIAECVAELATLVADVEAADDGSRSLDTRIHYGFQISGGPGEDMASLLIKEGISWPVVEQALDETVPPYSTSLDAALPGEEIVFAVRSVKQRRWGAMQRTGDGGEILVWAATEPLARRLAAIKCRQAELDKALKDEDDFNASLDNYQPVSPAVAEEPAPAGPALTGEDSAPDSILPEEDYESGSATPPQDDAAPAPVSSPGAPEGDEQEWKILF